MTNDELKKLLSLLGLIAIAGCGGGNGGTASSDSAHKGAGKIAVKISGSKSFNPALEAGKIAHYTVTIEGAGISKPITAEFPGEASEGIIEGIPNGDGRMIKAKAINKNDQVIRGGEAAGIATGDGVTEVPITMEAVPIFINIADGAVIDNTRLMMRIYSDPAHVVMIEDVGKSGALLDAAANLPEIHLDEATGLGLLAPRLLPPGSHTVSVRDIVTERSSQISITLTDGSKRVAAPLAAAAGENDSSRARASAF